MLEQILNKIKVKGPFVYGETRLTYRTRLKLKHWIATPLTKAPLYYVIVNRRYGICLQIESTPTLRSDA